MNIKANDNNSEAEELYKSAEEKLIAAKDVLKDKDIADVLAKLAALYSYQKQYDKALEVNKKLLEYSYDNNPQVKILILNAKIDTTMRYAHPVPKRKLEAINVLNNYNE